MKKVLFLLPFALLVACDNGTQDQPQDTTKPDTEVTQPTQPMPAQPEAPQFPDLTGDWNMEVFSRSTEESMGMPNLKGTLTFMLDNDGYLQGRLNAQVRDDEYKENPDDARQFSYKTDYAVWNALKQWNPTKEEWVGSERLDFNLRAVEVTGAGDEAAYPVPMDCSIFAGSKVEAPKSGKETYVFTCQANYKLDGWIERQ